MPVILKAWNASLGKPENIHSITNALKIRTPVDYAVHEGTLFTHDDKHTVAISGNLDLLVVPNSGSDLHMLPFEFNATGGPNDVLLYESTYLDTNSAGAASSFVNHHRTSALTAPFSAYENPYIDANSLGTQLDYSLMENTSGGPNKDVGGGTVGAVGEWKLDPTKNYLIRFTNNSGAENTVRSGVVIYLDELS